MISEAVGKILGMAMAYGVSSLGLFLAYVNYRKRIVKADRVMTGKAWAVIALTFAGIAAGVLVVAGLAEVPAPESATVAEVSEAQPVVPLPETAPAAEPESGRWPLVGIVLPAAIFLVATWITAGLYRHFSQGMHQ